MELLLFCLDIIVDIMVFSKCTFQKMLVDIGQRSEMALFI